MISWFACWRRSSFSIRAKVLESITMNPLRYRDLEDTTEPDVDKRQATNSRVAASTMTCGKDRNESKIAVCSLCPATTVGTFFHIATSTEERPKTKTGMTSPDSPERRATDVKKPTEVGLFTRDGDQTTRKWYRGPTLHRGKTNDMSR